MKIFFLFLKITGKILSIKMVADGTGVKNWCQITFLNILVKNTS